jgi:hypothetical protein
MNRRVSPWWVLPPVIWALYLTHSRAGLVLAGLVSVVCGTVVALDYRGVSERVPPVLGMSKFSRDASPASTRKSFGWLAFAGVLMILYALGRP